MIAPWSFKRDGKTLFTAPKVAILRSMVFSHLIHHRGQLTVLMRQAGLKVPGVYGPAREEWAAMGMQPME
jgi:uncharacterized damage-inducible protein DinB